jgi:hypothetical protein
MGARREADASSGGSADVGAIVVLVVYHAIVEWLAPPHPDRDTGCHQRGVPCLLTFPTPARIGLFGADWAEPD